MVKPERIKKLNSHTYAGGPVLYWMNRDIRAEDNWALLYAQELALANKASLLVVYNLTPGFLGGGLRQHVFKVGALESVQNTLGKKSIPFFLVAGKDTEKDLVSFISKQKIGALVTDFSPLHLPRKWVAHVRKSISIPMYGVDTHNIVPVWVASPKQEYGAYTLRPKLQKLLPEYLEDFPALKKHPHKFSGNVPEINWSKILEDKSLGRGVSPVSWIKPDHASAHKALKYFLEHKISNYEKQRNDPVAQAQSDLSPYLHYGILSAQRVALEAKKTKKNIADFLEELIVRRELSDNFCFYNQNYDKVTGFPDWAQKSLAKHEGDKREFIYTKKQFENAQTHDPLWNAAQKEMLTTGKMHGYMRMYWAKKILEWTNTPEEAMKIAIYLNDKYELDGRDPNGYTGIAWSIGGVHDRAWFERPIFGLVRYMNARGCASKFDTEAYIKKWYNDDYAK